jgi:hypothetical protein
VFKGSKGAKLKPFVPLESRITNEQRLVSKPDDKIKQETGMRKT